MQIVEPKVEYWAQKDPIEHVCRCAQISYQSEPKTGDAAKIFYEALKKRGHNSVFRHESCYYITPGNVSCYKLRLYLYCPYIYFEILADNRCAIITNKNFLFDHPILEERLVEYKATPEEFKKECPELFRPTFCLTTQIATSREVLLRTSPQSITEMSTRYIKFGGKVEPTIVRPWWMTKEEAEKWSNKQLCYEYDTDWDYEKGGILANYMLATQEAFDRYIRLTKNLNMKPEDARGILPLDTMTKIMGTYTIKEWEHILQLRLLGTTGKPQGNAVVIAELIYQELQKLGYKFNENNELVYGL